MDKLLLRPTEAADLIGVGRSKLYQLLATGELPSIRVGRSVRVPLHKLREWIDEKLTAGVAVGDVSSCREVTSEARLIAGAKGPPSPGRDDPARGPEVT